MIGWFPDFADVLLELLIVANLQSWAVEKSRGLWLSLPIVKVIWIPFHTTRLLNQSIIQTERIPTLSSCKRGKKVYLAHAPTRYYQWLLEEDASSV